MAVGRPDHHSIRPTWCSDRRCCRRARRCRRRSRLQGRSARLPSSRVGASGRRPRVSSAVEVVARCSVDGGQRRVGRSSVGQGGGPGSHWGAPSSSRLARVARCAGSGNRPGAVHPGDGCESALLCSLPHRCLRTVVALSGTLAPVPRDPVRARPDASRCPHLLLGCGDDSSPSMNRRTP
jgi:hypothetical protein